MLSKPAMKRHLCRSGVFLGSSIQTDVDTMLGLFPFKKAYMWLCVCIGVCKQVCVCGLSSHLQCVLRESVWRAWQEETYHHIVVPEELQLGKVDSSCKKNDIINKIAKTCESFLVTHICHPPPKINMAHLRHLLEKLGDEEKCFL